MIYLLDTNVLSESTKSRRNPGVVAWMNATPLEQTASSAVCFGEIERGLLKAEPTRQAKLRVWYSDLLFQYAGRILYGFRKVCQRS